MSSAWSWDWSENQCSRGRCLWFLCLVFFQQLNYSIVSLLQEYLVYSSEKETHAAQIVRLQLKLSTADYCLLKVFSSFLRSRLLYRPRSAASVGLCRQLENSHLALQSVRTPHALWLSPPKGWCPPHWEMDTCWIVCPEIKPKVSFCLIYQI